MFVNIALNFLIEKKTIAQGNQTAFLNQKYIDKGLHNVKAWEPGGDQGSHSKSRRLPAPCRKLRFKLFFPLKVDPLNLQS